VSLEVGLETSIEEHVTADQTAEALGSGDVPVLGTPALLALVERAAVLVLSGRLGHGEISVGTSVELRHLAPTPIGGTVTAALRLASVDGRTLDFEFRVTDRAGPVATGRHRRAVVDRDAFLASARAR